MRISIAASLAICLVPALAFKNTSPFLLFSTTENLVPTTENRPLQSRTNVLQTALQALGACPSKYYVVVNQESLNIEDITGKRAVPFLKRAMQKDAVKSSMFVEEVVDEAMVEGEHDMAGPLIKYLQEHCGAGLEVYNDMHSEPLHGKIDPGKYSSVITNLHFTHDPMVTSERSAMLADHDYFLSTFLAQVPEGEDYTIIYTGSPPLDAESRMTYEPTFPNPLKVELKRQTDLLPRADDGALGARLEKNKTGDPTPLFEKYQFFTPGIFMGIITVLILGSILSVGIAAIAGLEVSYGAFDKEMGPGAGKKQ